MNAQELFLDVSSGRFLDGESAIPTTKPSFFSDEQKRVNISVLKVKNNKVSSVTPSPDSRFKFRLGTQSLKLADGVDVTTVPPNLITALGTVSTASSRQAIATASIFTYAPVTATFEIFRDNRSAVTPVVNAKIFTFTETKAAITATVGSTTLPNETILLNIPNMGCAIDNVKANSGIYFSANLSTVVTATFAATITGGVVTTISIIDDGFGYLDGQYALTFSGGSPSVTASATAVALNGEIQSVSIVAGGSGYSSAPSVTLFAPAKKIKDITPIGVGFTSTLNANGIQQIKFTGGLRSSVTLSTPISFLIGQPDTTSTVTAKIQAVATIAENPINSWTIQVTCAGYGYSSTPVVTLSDYSVSYNKIQTRAGLAVTVTSQAGTFSEGSVIPVFGLPFSFFSEIQKGSKSIERVTTAGGVLTKVRIGYPNTQSGIRELYNATQRILGGGTLPIYDPNAGPSSDRNALFAYNARTTIKDPRLLRINTANGDSSERTLASLNGWNPVLQDPSLVGKKLYYTFTQDGHTPTRYALYSIEFSEINASYVVEQVGFVDKRFFASTISQDGGGIFEPTFEEIDAGSGYSRSLPLVFTYIGSLNEVSNFYKSTSPNRTIALPPILTTILSTTASVVTSFDNSFFNYGIQSGGFGYIQKNTSVQISGGSVSNGILSATLTNSPRGYLAGDYECTVSAPSSGTTASIRLIVGSSENQGSNYSVAILNAGSGFTSAPLITAPEINVKSGFVTDIQIVNQSNNPFTVYEGYGQPEDAPIFFNVQASPTTGGTAIIALRKEIASITNSGQTIYGRHIPQIINAGFGYTTAPTLTAVTPIGKIGSLVNAIITNEPIGYQPDKVYTATVATSPESGGTAILEFVISSSGQKNAYFANSGYGYTSVPAVTAPSPDADNGYLTSIAIVTSGLGYAPSSYQCNITKTPSTTGRTAQINFVVDEDRNTSLDIIDVGSGYVTAPIITVVTPAGNIISGITITCQGSYYINSTATFMVDDLSGGGAILGSPIINSGRILGINVRNGGYNFSNNPKITFSSPTAPVVATIPEYVVQGDLNITTASANAILSTSTQRDILMEVYETDGTNEQVVAQATVSLAKRVLE